MKLKNNINECQTSIFLFQYFSGLERKHLPIKWRRRLFLSLSARIRISAFLNPLCLQESLFLFSIYFCRKSIKVHSSISKNGQATAQCQKRAFVNMCNHGTKDFCMQSNILKVINNRLVPTRARTLVWSCLKSDAALNIYYVKTEMHNCRTVQSSQSNFSLVRKDLIKPVIIKLNVIVQMTT